MNIKLLCFADISKMKMALKIRTFTSGGMQSWLTILKSTVFICQGNSRYSHVSTW